MRPKTTSRKALLGSKRLGALFGLAAGLALAAVHSPRAGAQSPPSAPPGAPPNPDDILGNITVVASGTRQLPKIGVLPSLASDIEDVTLRSVMRRDLDLSGEFEVLPDSQAPEGLYLSDSPVDVKAWAAKKVEAVVKVSGKRLSDDKAELRAQAYFVKTGDQPVFDKRFSVPLGEVRTESHRLADLVIGALTGQNGGFASTMTFTSGTGSLRRVFTIDADGHDAKAVSPQGQLAIAPAFGKDHQLYYAAALKKNQDFQVFTPNGGPLRLPVRGSVYGMAFSKDRSQVALSIGQDSAVRIYAGPDFARLKPMYSQTLAIHPTFTPSGKIAYSGEGKFSQRIYVDGKPISPDGLMASSPTFCNHPDGVRAVYSVGVGKNNDLVSSAENGGGMARLTQGQGRNSYPACSPDGRLVAFFSTRKSNEGPGLYIMRVDGLRPKRISNLLGESLRWDPLPPGKGVEIKN